MFHAFFGFFDTEKKIENLLNMANEECHSSISFKGTTAHAKQKKKIAEDIIVELQS